MDVAVLIHLNYRSVKDRILINIGIEGQLRASGLAGNTVSGIQYLELTSISVAGAAGGDRGDVVVVHVHDSGARRNTGRIGKGHIYRVVADPGLGPEGKDLLLILPTIDGYLIGNIAVRRTGDIGRQILCPRSTTTVNILCSSKDLLSALQFYTGQVGIDF